MNSRSSRFHLAAKRTSAIAVVTAVIASLAATLTATPAAALPPTIALASVTASDVSVAAASGAATVQVAYVTKTAWAPGDGIAEIDIAIQPGSALPATVPPAKACSVTNPTVADPFNGSATCPVDNPSNIIGVNHVQVSADNVHADGTTTPVASNATVIFSGDPTSVSIAPSSSRVTVGTCALYTLKAFDAQSRPAGHQSFTVTVVENSATAALSVFDQTCGAAPAPTTTPNTPPGFTTATFPESTGDDGSVTFGMASDTTGSGTISATNGTAATPAPFPTVNWVAGGADAVKNLQISEPANVTQYVGTTASFILTATDQFGDPVQDVAIQEQIDGPDHAAKSVCGTTNHLGVATCAVLGAAAGTDDITFWVDQSSAQPAPPDPYPTEPQARASAIFRTLPTPDLPTRLTCVDQLASDKNAASPSCTLPTSQTSVVFTETLTSGGAPLAGAVIAFTPTVERLGGHTISSLPAPTYVTTDSAGTATFTVLNPGPANGDSVRVDSSIGANFLNTATATWATPQEDALTLTPQLQTVTRGGQVSLTAQVTDQFGAPWPATETVSSQILAGSPDFGATIAPTQTSTSGTAVLTYQSSVSAASESVDSIRATAGSLTGFADVVLVVGSSTAATVTVDTTGNGNSSVCPSSTGIPSNTNLPLGSTTRVCAIVKNSNNEVLAGRTVTFSVDIGQVGGTTTSSAKTYSVPSQVNGIAVAVVSSTTSGTQTVTASTDGATGSGTLTYALPTLDKARNISVSPTSASIVAGSSQKFTWTVVDQFANPVANVALTYIQAGAGLSGATSSGTLLTGPDGTASVVVSTSTTDSGAGSITATIQQPSAPSPLNQCTQPKGTPSTSVTAGNCTAAATYTVVTGSPPAHVALTTTQVTKGHQEVVTAKVTNGDGTPSANQVVRFLVTGANGLIGSAQTNASGVAIFSYPAKHAGVDRISAFVDINNDTLQESNEPGKHTKVIVGGIKEHPTMFLTTKHRSVTIHVRTHPVLPRAVVKYYVKRYGKFHKIGTSHAGLLGKASMKFFFPKGVVRTFKAKVIGNQGIKGGKTKKKTIRIR